MKEQMKKIHEFIKLLGGILVIAFFLELIIAVLFAPLAGILKTLLITLATMLLMFILTNATDPNKKKS